MNAQLIYEFDELNFQHGQQLIDLLQGELNLELLFDSDFDDDSAHFFD
jgi:hypothetical protein